MKMTARIPVQLGVSSAPSVVHMTEDERTAVDIASVKLGYEHVSTMVRDIAVAAAGHKGDPYITCREAADRAGLPLGKWLRAVLFAALEIEPRRSNVFDAQKQRARAFVVTACQ